MYIPTEAARTYYNILKGSGKHNTKCVQQRRRNRLKWVSDMTKHNHAHFRLHDITTSGFTEVYIQDKVKWKECLIN